jgi:cytoplasmic iron level regulating protein YaaA (DUF328/UPF0246 family)
VENIEIIVKLFNKMEHPLIVQPSRAKFLKIEVKRENKTVWQNYLKDPSEDKQAYFAYSFKQDVKRVIIPAYATEGSVYNLEAKETKELKYSLPELKKSDKIIVKMYVQFAKSDCAKVIDLNDSNLTDQQLMKVVEFINK